MTEAARAVLGDCRYVWDRLELCRNLQEFRVLWLSGVALVRMVGDVLHRVDSQVGTAMCQSIANAYESRQKNEKIYKDFIKAERDQLIHTYESMAYTGDYIVLGVEADGVVEMFGVDECLYKPIESGPFAGEDQRDVLKLAIDWWAQELDLIDSATGNF